MKIYTKTGDKGESSLYGGRRLPKNNVRFTAYGTVDELSAQLGYVRTLLAAEPNCDPAVGSLIEQIQRHLLDIGAHLATPYEAQQVPPSLPQLSDSWVTTLEQSIDTLDAQLPPLHTFILPGGTAAASVLHIARTVCRRAERCIVQLAQVDYVAPMIIQYFNRLADWLFVAARYSNQVNGHIDQQWKT